MNPKNLLVNALILQSAVTVCRAGVFTDSLISMKSSELLVQATIKIMKTCYESDTSAIGIGGNPPVSIIVALSSGEFSAPVILLNNATRRVDNWPSSLRVRYKLHRFVIMVSSPMELQRILENVKKSRWWNHMARLYILDWPLSVDGCSRAYEMLWTAWMMNMLEAKFMCVDETRRPLIYTFNPYTSDAPEPWKLRNTYRGDNDHPWALLVREYDDSRNVCDNLDYEKTTKLGGYVTWVLIVQGMVGCKIHLADENGPDYVSGFWGDLLMSIFREVNTTMRLRVLESLKIVRRLQGPKRTVGEAMANKADGLVDFGFLKFYTRDFENTSVLYPWGRSGISVLTQYSGYKSQWSKFVSVLDLSSRIGFGLVIIVTVAFIKYFQRQTLSTAILNTARVICSSSLVQVPNTDHSRIYLSSLFIFIITILGIYQGALGSLLSKQVRLPDIDSRLDLAQSNLTIYAHLGLKKLFLERAFQGRFVLINTFNCTEYVLRYPRTAACLNTVYDTIEESVRSKLHKSKHMVDENFVSFPIRDDWPLEPKMQRVFQRVFEAYLWEHAWRKHYRSALHVLDVQERGDSEGDARVLTVNDLGFAFGILGVGLGCATLCFIIEIATRRCKARSRIVKIRDVRPARN